nr:MAG TPA: hypothetical protein [Caudoviricetes sp.]
MFSNNGYITIVYIDCIKRLYIKRRIFDCMQR